MIIKRVSLLLFPIIIFLFTIQNVLAVGDFTINLYENEREVIFSEDQESQTIYMDGIVNYSGVSATPYIISLTSYSDFGESTISPEYMTFHTTGSEEFTVESIIPSDHENGTTGVIMAQGHHQEGGVTKMKSDHCNMIILHHSPINDSNNNLNNSENNKQNDSLFGINGVFILSIIIIIIAIIIVIIYKKI